MRLVDLDDHIYCGEDGDYARYNIDQKIPTIDAVPVVRCRDCEYWKHHSAVLDRDYCELTATECEGDHFCSWGEKKNGKQ